MPKIAYIDWKPKGTTLDTVAQANRICAEYQAQGFNLTLRQLYYQFVSRGLIPNNDREYKNLGNTINQARLAGLLDWYYIEDRTRNLRGNAHWSDPAQIMRSAADSFALSKWATQPYRPEVWIEKDALVGVIEGVCARNDVPFFSCRGYTSQSEVWRAGQRLEGYVRNGQAPIILHLGDHDPSGKDMTRDITDRLATFMGGTDLERLALNWDQIEQYQPPPNPAKITDSRAKAYIAEFGSESWELDALEPTVIVQLVEDAIRRVRDQTRWDEVVAQETAQRETLTLAADRWEAVATWLQANQQN